MDYQAVINEVLKSSCAWPVVLPMILFMDLGFDISFFQC
jgi:hypothetical protein